MGGKPLGIVSLLALIIMTTVTATALGASAIIIEELQQTESYDQAVAAGYAAESGLENGLFLVKERRSLNPTITELQADLKSSSVPGEDNDWERTSSLDDQFSVVRLPTETTTHLDFVDPVDPSVGEGCGATGSCVQSIEIVYSDRCDGYPSEHGFSNLEITMLPLLAPGAASLDVSKEVHACNYVPATGFCARIVLNAIDAVDINPDSYYRFSFTTLSPGVGPDSAGQSCTIENLTVRAWSKPGGAGFKIPVSTRMIIKSVGSFGRSQQALTAQVPMRAPASGLFNYVVFSETDLVITK